MDLKEISNKNATYIIITSIANCSTNYAMNTSFQKNAAFLRNH